jgi:hypothetical protein
MEDFPNNSFPSESARQARLQERQPPSHRLYPKIFYAKNPGVAEPSYGDFWSFRRNPYLSPAHPGSWLLGDLIGCQLLCQNLPLVWGGGGAMDNLGAQFNQAHNFSPEIICSSFEGNPRFSGRIKMQLSKGYQNNLVGQGVADIEQ